MRKVDVRSCQNLDNFRKADVPLRKFPDDDASFVPKQLRARYVFVFNWTPLVPPVSLRARPRSFSENRADRAAPRASLSEVSRKIKMTNL